MLLEQLNPGNIQFTLFLMMSVITVKKTESGGFSKQMTVDDTNHPQLSPDLSTPELIFISEDPALFLLAHRPDQV